ncbi:metallophosphoesterase [Indiicoccus explosivorum]|uniref:metallophosphoesterase n=1 Tax=Indiicoccus explosivorum TaxID=1917864 RepID=UPI000B4356E7|nr:metallophosphoesterase [Indiicoccus explosivorum]
MKKWLLVSGILLSAITLFIWMNNKWLEVSSYSISSPDIPKTFDGARVVQISDLHNTVFGKNHSALLNKTKFIDPDVILITGDIVDSSRYDLNVMISLTESLLEIAPVYFVTGNQEFLKGRAEKTISAIKASGVIVLENEMVEWKREGEKIYIAGIHDPLVERSTLVKKYVKKALADIQFTEKFTLLLAHRPELVVVYAETEADIVFSGHAHGGQIRIPKIGGIFAPGQGFFPELTEGVHEFGNTLLVISRGLGNSSFPLRINNRPEIVVVILEHGKQAEGTN